jgi:integrase
MRIPILTFIFDRKHQSSKNKYGMVELRISLGKERKYISTGVKLLPKEWSNGSVVGRKDWKELNDRLQVFKKKCSDVILQMMDDGELNLKAIPELLKDSLIRSGTFIDYAREKYKLRMKTISDGTQQHYAIMFKFLEEWKGLVQFTDITEANIMKMDEALKNRGLKECSRWNYHKMVKTFILSAMQDGLVKKNPYAYLKIKRGNESGLKRYLTPEEFHRFESCEIPIQRLERVRDVFVFQTYTMMSYSDLAKFDYRNCFTIDGQMVYKANRQKTSQEFIIPIVSPAMRILKKYNYRLPIISNVQYNAFLKNAVLYAHIDKPVTTHWARHTGATMFVNEGKIPMYIVQHMLGHASIRETERTYAKVLDNSIVETMAGYQKKFG